MNETNYRLRLVKNNIEIEVGGDKDFVEKKFKELADSYLSNPSNNDSSRENDEPEANKEKPRLVAFVDQKAPRSTATELMPVLVYYAEHFEGMKQFNKDDIKTLYRRYDPKKRPKNIYQAIVDIGQHQGYFENVLKSKGYFKLTDTGEHFVEVVLPKK